MPDGYLSTIGPGHALSCSSWTATRVPRSELCDPHDTQRIIRHVNWPSTWTKQWYGERVRRWSGSYKKSCAFTRWMVARSELSRTLTEFESTLKANRGETAIRHHEQVLVVRSALAKQVNDLVSSIEEMRNPSLDESANLVVVDSKEILDDTEVRIDKNIETIGEKLHSERICIAETAKKRQLHLTHSVKTTAPTLQQGGDQSSLSFTTWSCWS